MKLKKNIKFSNATIRKWKEIEDQLRDIKKKDTKYRNDRKGKVIRNFTDEEEECIINFIIDARDKNKPVSTRSVISYADTIKYEFSKKSIKTKLRWCYRFIKKHGFSIRIITHVGQSIPENMKDIKESFINEVIKLKNELNILYDESYRIINMDETPCVLDMTIDFTGKRNISFLTTGREHYRISVILGITGSGIKLTPLIIVKGQRGKTIEKDLNNLKYVKDRKLIIFCQEDGWCTTSIFIE